MDTINKTRRTRLAAAAIYSDISNFHDKTKDHKTKNSLTKIKNRIKTLFVAFKGVELLSEMQTLEQELNNIKKEIKQLINTINPI